MEVSTDADAGAQGDGQQQQQQQRHQPGEDNAELGNAVGAAPNRRQAFVVLRGEKSTRQAAARVQRARADYDEVARQVESVRKSLADLEAVQVANWQLVEDAEAQLQEAKRKEAEVAQHLAEEKARAAGSAAAAPADPPLTGTEQILYILRRVRDGTIDDAVRGGASSAAQELEGLLAAASGVRHRSPSVYREPPPPSAIGGRGPGMAAAAGATSISGHRDGAVASEAVATAVGGMEVLGELAAAVLEPGAGQSAALSGARPRAQEEPPPHKAAKVVEVESVQGGKAPGQSSVDVGAIQAHTLQVLVDKYAEEQAAAAAVPVAQGQTAVEAWKNSQGLLPVQTSAASSTLSPVAEVQAAQSSDAIAASTLAVYDDAQMLEWETQIRRDLREFEVARRRRGDRDGSSPSGRDRSRSTESMRRDRASQDGGL